MRILVVLLLVGIMLACMFSILSYEIQDYKEHRRNNQEDKKIENK